MKPTQISVPKGGLNQLPPTCKISGDIRLTPFYKVSEVKEAVEGYVKDIMEVIRIILFLFISLIFILIYI